MCTSGQTTNFAFEKHRRPDAYARITAQVGAVVPPDWLKKAAEQEQAYTSPAK